MRIEDDFVRQVQQGLPSLEAAAPASKIAALPQDQGKIRSPERHDESRNLFQAVLAGRNFDAFRTDLLIAAERLPALRENSRVDSLRAVRLRPYFAGAISHDDRADRMIVHQLA